MSASNDFETPLDSRRSKLCKYLIFTSVSLFITLAGIIIYLEATRKSEFDQYPPGEKRPLSDSTTDLLKEFSLNINSSVDPCDDFYEYACGSFASRYSVPRGMDEESYFSIELKKIQQKTIAILD